MQSLIVTALTALLLPGLASAAPTPSSYGHTIHQQQQQRDANPGCQSKSLNDFRWTIEDFDFHSSYTFTTPAHQNSWGYASFNVTNPALDYRAACTASSSQLSDFFYGTQPYNCSVPDGSSAVSTFDFSRPSGQLRFNQTWTCSDADPQYPTTIHAYGAANLTLDCTDKTWQNPDWQMGEIYSTRTVTCAPATLPLKPYRMEAVA